MAVLATQRPRREERRGPRILGCTAALLAALVATSLFVATARAEDLPPPGSDAAALASGSTDTASPASPGTTGATADGTDTSPDAPDTSATAPAESGTAVATTKTSAPATDATGTATEATDISATATDAAATAPDTTVSTGTSADATGAAPDTTDTSATAADAAATAPDMTVATGTSTDATGAATETTDATATAPDAAAAAPDTTVTSDTPTDATSPIPDTTDASATAARATDPTTDATDGATPASAGARVDSAGRSDARVSDNDRRPGERKGSDAVESSTDSVPPRSAPALAAGTSPLPRDSASSTGDVGDSDAQFGPTSPGDHRAELSALGDLSGSAATAARAEAAVPHSSSTALETSANGVIPGRADRHLIVVCEPAILATTFSDFNSKRALLARSPVRVHAKQTEPQARNAGQSRSDGSQRPISPRLPAPDDGPPAPRAPGSLVGSASSGGSQSGGVLVVITARLGLSPPRNDRVVTLGERQRRALHLVFFLERPG
jgi:hypothetical protein